MRTRFPPSPTGFLHLGSLRTALFAWLVAKQTNGVFTLRIEDTDRAREVPGAVKNIVSTLQWAGIPPDEGVMLDTKGELTEKGSFGPYHQSERLPIYREHVQKLLDSGHAYHCFCTSERLEQMRKIQEQRRQAPMYDRMCVDLPKEEVEERINKGEKYVIRMKIPREETIEYEDLIYGKLSFKGHTIDDQVLVKSDGFPTYHLAHVVDDHLMKTDLVNRGEEWLSSLPKHILLFRFFGWISPKYAHVPLLLNKDRSKLSKRQNDVAAEDYKEKGYLPEAMMNFLALLGWNPGTEQEIFSLEELIKAFSLDRVQKSGAVFDIEKLDWVQGQWIRRMPKEEFEERIRPFVAEAFPEAAKDPRFAERASLVQDRVLFFKDAPAMLKFFYEPPKPAMELIANPKQKIEVDQVPTILGLIRKALEAIPEKEWSHDSIKNVLEKEIISSGLKKGQILWPLRAMLTGQEFSPGAYEVAAALGKKETLERLQKVV